MKEYDEEDKPVRNHSLRSFVTVLVILGVLCGGGYLLKGKVKEKAASVIGNQVVEKAAESLGIPSEQAQEILNSMAPEDRQTVTDIVENHMDSSTVKEAQQIVKDRDVSEAKQFAQQELTTEEQEQLKDIARKYAPAYSSQIQAAQQAMQ